MRLFEMRKAFIVIVDKSSGTRYENTKEKLVAMIEEHIQNSLAKRSNKKYDDSFPYILATNYKVCWK